MKQDGNEMDRKQFKTRILPEPSQHSSDDAQPIARYPFLNIGSLKEKRTLDEIHENTKGILRKSCII
jgi:hypothetical protein